MLHLYIYAIVSHIFVHRPLLKLDEILGGRHSWNFKAVLSLVLVDLRAKPAFATLRLAFVVVGRVASRNRVVGAMAVDALRSLRCIRARLLPLVRANARRARINTLTRSAATRRDLSA